MSRFCADRKRIAWLVILSWIAAALRFATVGSLVPFFDVLFGSGGAGEAAPVTRSILDRLDAWSLPSEGVSLLAVLAGILLLLLVLKGITSWALEIEAGRLAHGCVLGLTDDLHRAVLRQPQSFFTTVASGDLIARYTGDVEDVRLGLRKVSGKLISQPLYAIAALAATFWIAPRLAALALVFLPLVGLGLAAFTRRAKQRSRQLAGRRQTLVGRAGEHIRGARVLKAFGLESHAQSEFEGESASFYDEQMAVVRIEAVASPVIEILGSAAVLVIVLLGGQAVLGGSLTYGQFTAFYVALVSVFDPVRKLANTQVRLQRLRAGAERVFEILDRPGESETGGEEPPPLTDGLRFDAVSLTYPGSDAAALDEVSFRVGPGEIVAIVGSSGAGKSTLVNLVPRLESPGRGRVLWSGCDIASFDRQAWRERVGFVTQEILLFDATIEENIALGHPRADRAAVREAAARAQAESFIEALPEGYETRIGEGGSRLSVGERQRLCIARALVRRPEVLILDEASSALDPENETLIRRALERDREGRVTLVIAHSERLARSADRVVVLEAGRVVGQGTPEELLESCAVFRRLFAIEPIRGTRTSEEGR
ncbi:MAG: ABC transporter ATP-binding protein [Planctomycetota bacterium]